jgi:hypothetical protein
MASNKLVLAAATGSTGGLGKITTIPIAGVLYVRCPGTAARIKWIIKSDKAASVQAYVSPDIVQSVTLDVSGNTLANTHTVFVGGLTFTAETNTNVRASRQFAIDGNGTADGVELAAAINYGTALTVTACDLLETIVVTSANGVDSKTYTGAAAEAISDREFTRTNAATAAASLTRCINADTAVTGVTAVNSDGAEVALTNTQGTAVAIVNALGHITATNYGVPGVTATPAAGIVTIVPKAVNGAYTIQAVTGTAAGACVVTHTTLASLVRDGAATAIAADSTTLGYTLDQYTDGLTGYLGISNSDGAAVLTPVISAYRFAS